MDFDKINTKNSSKKTQEKRITEFLVVKGKSPFQ